MNVLSCFDGMSCGQIALERAGIKVDNYFASEIDKYAIKVTQSHYPDTIQLGSIVNWKSWNLPKIDLLIGGSPCQGFSNAGRGLNFDDPRSKLFFVYVKILKNLKKKNPDLLFMLENVRMKNEWQDIITQYLGVEPVKLNSSLVSAQNRVRLYWANWSISQPQDKEIFLKDIIEYGEVDRDKSYTIDANYFKGGNPRSNFEDGKRQLVFEHQSHKRAMVKVHGTALRNQVTKRGVEEQLNVRKDGKSNTVVSSYSAKLNGLYLSSDEIEKIQHKKSAKELPKGKREGAIPFPQNPNKKSQCLLAGDITGLSRSTNVVDDGIGYRKLTPIECERLQTVPDNYTNMVSNTQRYKMLGNGWTVDVVAHIFRSLGG